MAGLTDLVQGILGGLDDTGGSSGSDFLYSLLNSGQSRHAGIGGGMPGAPQMPRQGLPAPQAPQGQPMPEQPPQAAPASQGGGLPGLLQNLFNPQASGRNQTIGWLTQQGLDQGTATLLASNKPALQSYLLKRAQGADPMDALNLEKTQLEIDNLRNPTTNDIREYQLAKNQGYRGTIRDWILETKKAGATSIDARQMGTIPPGYRAEYDANGQVSQLVPIPGGPVAAEADAAKNTADIAEENKATSTDIITNAASKIRTLAKEPGAIGLIGAGASYIPNTPAAEVYRQVEVLKSNAKVENLQAMRAASPTGGALGAVSDKENEMLAAKAGALDPKSPYFQDQLDDYERTLLRTVHGRTVGDAIFEQTRAAAPSAETPKAIPQIGESRYGYRFKGGDPSEPSNWEKAN